MAKKKNLQPVAAIDPNLFDALDKLRNVSASLSGLKVPESIIAELEESIDKLETSPTAQLEDSYSYCCELINPHVASRNGLNSITQNSLCSSVNDSLEYLIEFWLANKDKPGIDLKL